MLRNAVQLVKKKSLTQLTPLESQQHEPLALGLLVLLGKTLAVVFTLKAFCNLKNSLKLNRKQTRIEVIWQKSESQFTKFFVCIRQLHG